MMSSLESRLFTTCGLLFFASLIMLVWRVNRLWGRTEQTQGEKNPFESVGARGIFNPPGLRWWLPAQQARAYGFIFGRKYKTLRDPLVTTMVWSSRAALLGLIAVWLKGCVSGG